jgi:hypothetical protein
MAVENINYQLLAIVIKNIANDSSALNDKNVQVLKNILDKIIPYNAYTALINQSGTSAPVATVFSNNAPGIWTRDNLGVSKFTLTTPYCKK